MKKNARPLNLNIDPKLLDRIDSYRFKRKFPTRTEAIEFLLGWALHHDPKPEKEHVSA